MKKLEKMFKDAGLYSLDSPWVIEATEEKVFAVVRAYAQSAIDEIKEKQQALDKTASELIMQIRVKSAIALKDDSNEIDQMLFDLEYKIGLITDIKLELK